MKRRHKRIIFILCCLGALGLAIALVLTALNNNLQFFLTPTEVAAKQASGNKTIRLGGLVELGSIQREGTLTRFTITDTTNKVSVVYNGITPDLFKDGRGCVVVGRMGSDGIFHADTVMAKHDENYMPPEAGQAIDKAKAAKTLVER
ncbi:MAG TPA: cytochrome c maturation protein CcmE [Pyrinomonadaceae bacterium]|jgi:cytochrome c-type biogenesis protein CcmE|nr:cytochrome c maturation protein CcmE [Pyrinomonadaceae bacterium]